jgi:hypothetical protein
MDAVNSRFGAFLCALALIQLMGGHYAVLQATAWVGMVVNYCKAEGVGVGGLEASLRLHGLTPDSSGSIRLRTLWRH